MKKFSVLKYKNLFMYQDEKMLNFSIDSFILSRSINFDKKYESIIDIGTNNGIVPLIVSRYTKSKILGIDIQKEAIEIAKKNIELNNKEKQIQLAHCDFKKMKSSDKFDLIICNPPFFTTNNNISPNTKLAVAKHEINLTLKELVSNAARIAENKATFSFVHKPDRLIEIFTTLKEHDFAVKKLMFVYPKKNKQANLIYIEALYKGADSGLVIMPPLFTHDANGKYSKECQNIFKD